MTSIDYNETTLIEVKYITNDGRYGIFTVQFGSKNVAPFTEGICHNWQGGQTALRAICPPSYYKLTILYTIYNIENWHPVKNMKHYHDDLLDDGRG